MDSTLIDSIRAQMHLEFERTSPPPGFPAFPPIPAARHTSDEFWALEQEHVFVKSWIMAGRAEDVPNAGDYFVFRDLGTFRLAGKEARHRIFELVGRSGMVDDGQRRLVAAFEAARRLLELGDSAGAKRGLEELVAQFPDDGPTRYYLNDISDKISWRRQSAGV